MKKKVSICDDDLDILELCRYILEKHGYIVATYSSYINMLNEIKQHPPDIILIDLWMPGVGGEEATKNIKSDDLIRHIPVLLFSANSEIEQIASSVNAEGFIKKPFDTKELITTIENNILRPSS